MLDIAKLDANTIRVEIARLRAQEAQCRADAEKMREAVDALTTLLRLTTQDELVGVEPDGTVLQITTLPKTVADAAVKVLSETGNGSADASSIIEEVQKLGFLRRVASPRNSLNTALHRDSRFERDSKRPGTWRLRVTVKAGGATP
jgi:hypothetical protein